MTHLPDFLNSTDYPASRSESSAFPLLRFTLRGMMITVMVVALYLALVRSLVLPTAELFQTGPAQGQSRASTSSSPVGEQSGVEYMGVLAYPKMRGGNGGD